MYDPSGCCVRNASPRTLFPLSTDQSIFSGSVRLSRNTRAWPRARAVARVRCLYSRCEITLAIVPNAHEPCLPRPAGKVVRRRRIGWGLGMCEILKCPLRHAPRDTSPAGRGRQKSPRTQTPPTRSRPIAHRRSAAGGLPTAHQSPASAGLPPPSPHQIHRNRPKSGVSSGPSSSGAGK